MDPGEVADPTALVRVRRLAGSGWARSARESAGLSLEEVAGPVGVDRSTIHRWETGKRRPHGEAAIRYLRVLEGLSNGS